MQEKHMKENLYQASLCIGRIEVALNDDNHGIDPSRAAEIRDLLVEVREPLTKAIRLLDDVVKIGWDGD